MISLSLCWLIFAWIAGLCTLSTSQLSFEQTGTKPCWCGAVQQKFNMICLWRADVHVPMEFGIASKKRKFGSERLRSSQIIINNHKIALGMRRSLAS